MTKDNGKDDRYKGHFEEPPKAKGGRRGTVQASLANLKRWPKGTSGNPLGTPRSITELNRHVRDQLHPLYAELFRLFYDPETPIRDIRYGSSP